MERLDEYVIYVDLDSVTKVVCEHLVNQPLLGRTSVLQPKMHYFVTEDSPLGDEGSLFLVVWV